MSLVFALVPLVASAQTGRLSGTVLDAADRQPLPGVNVVLVGQDAGTATNAEGAFDLEVDPGTYTVRATLVGYAPDEREVALLAGQTMVLDITLREAPLSLASVQSEAERPYSAASSRAVRALDIGTRPVRSSQDLLQLAPGLVVAQHAGGGKAEQIFLRGFDADHGTDVAVIVDGVPVNMVSHGHGQGYADLHFVIPETVEAIDVAKGPYFAEYGNLATAGAVEFKTRDHLPANEVRGEVGAFNTVGLGWAQRASTGALIR